MFLLLKSVLIIVLIPIILIGIASDVLSYSLVIMATIYIWKGIK